MRKREMLAGLVSAAVAGVMTSKKLRTLATPLAQSTYYSLKSQVSVRDGRHVAAKRNSDACPLLAVFTRGWSTHIPPTSRNSASQT